MKTPSMNDPVELAADLLQREAFALAGDPQTADLIARAALPEPDAQARAIAYLVWALQELTEGAGG